MRKIEAEHIERRVSCINCLNKYCIDCNYNGCPSCQYEDFFTSHTKETTYPKTDLRNIHDVDHFNDETAEYQIEERVAPLQRPLRPSDFIGQDSNPSAYNAPVLSPIRSHLEDEHQMNRTETAQAYTPEMIRDHAWNNPTDVPSPRTRTEEAIDSFSRSFVREKR